MATEFFFEGTKLSLRERNRLKRFLANLFKKKRQDLSSLKYIFCTDRFLLDINQRYLCHDDYTDIITFNLADPKKPVEGEIYISADRVRENAGINKVSIKNELHRVIFHGALHLCGYKDKAPADKKAMRQEEDKCLASYFSTVPRGTNR